MLLPLFVKLICCESVFPTVTFPKSRLPGVAVSEPFGATAVPVRASACDPPGLLSVMVTLPVDPLADAGVKETLNVVEAFGATVAGSDRPLIAKPAPLTVAAETVRPALPVLFSVTV